MLRKHLLTLGLLAITGLAQAAETIDVYRDPNCGCCKEWIKHLGDNGFTVNDHVEPNMSAVKQRLGVAPRLASCHTGVIDGKFVEGHVPAEQVRLLAKRMISRASRCRACPWARRAWRWVITKMPTRSSA